MLAALAVLFVSFLYTIRYSFEQRVIGKGDTAPSFSVTTDSGKKISRTDFGGKVLVLNFWATWCPPCIQEMPSLNRFAQEMAPSGVVVLGVSVDKNEQTYKRFLQQAGLSFETSRDPEADISTDYGSFMWPETYIIDAKGKVVEKYIGDRDWTDPKIISSIKALL